MTSRNWTHFLCNLTSSPDCNGIYRTIHWAACSPSGCVSHGCSFTDLQLKRKDFTGRTVWKWANSSDAHFNFCFHHDSSVCHKAHGNFVWENREYKFHPRHRDKACKNVKGDLRNKPSLKSQFNSTTIRTKYLRKNIGGMTWKRVEALMEWWLSLTHQSTPTY